MFSRREFLRRTLTGSTLLAMGAGGSLTVPGFLARSARAAQPNQERILVVVEMTGGNDGLNTVIPYGDDAYHKARPTIGISQEELYEIDNHVGLHPAMYELSNMLDEGKLAIVQGVGYPNPNRSHFESMDIWQSADPRGRQKSGWLGRTAADLKVPAGKIPAFHIGKQELPLAMRGSGAVPTLHPDKPFGFEFYRRYIYDGGELRTESPIAPFIESPHANESDGGAAHQKLMRELADLSTGGSAGSALDFTRRISLDTYTTVDRLREIMSGDFEKPDPEYDFRNGAALIREHGLNYELQLVARMIQADFGARIYYVAQDGYDTHGDQPQTHYDLLETLSGSIGTFMAQLQESGHADRVVLVTYSEFGRRVQENSSRGTDHGAASCLFVAGNVVQAGLVGEYPKLTDLDDGDLKHKIDFRQVYATLLDQWLKVDSRTLLGGTYEHLPLLKKKQA